jgi:hypothetical protein
MGLRAGGTLKARRLTTVTAIHALRVRAIPERGIDSLYRWFNQ